MDTFTDKVISALARVGPTSLRDMYRDGSALFAHDMPVDGGDDDEDIDVPEDTVEGE